MSNLYFLLDHPALLAMIALVVCAAIPAFWRDE